MNGIPLGAMAFESRESAEWITDMAMSDRPTLNLSDGFSSAALTITSLYLLNHAVEKLVDA